MTTRREYMQEWRKTPNGQAARMASQRREKARQRALRMLAAKYHEEFDALFSRELQRIEEQFKQGFLT